jgi:hypothetical protein
MINRVAIFAASLVAALALAVGLFIAGIGPGSGAADLQPVSDPVAVSTDSPAPVVQVDTVYVTPQATPQDVVVTQVVPAANHGDDDNENEGSGH